LRTEVYVLGISPEQHVASFATLPIPLLVAPGGMGMVSKPAGSAPSRIWCP
jgi:hypothetical protein